MSLTCCIKTVVNPIVSRSFSVKFKKSEGKVDVKIYLSKVDDAGMLLDEMLELMPMGYGFRVNFVWKGVPDELRTSPAYKILLLKIFGKEDIGAPPGFSSTTSHNKSEKHESESEFDQQVRIVWTHVKEHGAAPDFKSRINDSRKLKIANYIRSVLGINEKFMSVSDALRIADGVLKYD